MLCGMEHTNVILVMPVECGYRANRFIGIIIEQCTVAAHIPIHIHSLDSNLGQNGQQILLLQMKIEKLIQEQHTDIRAVPVQKKMTAEKYILSATRLTAYMQESSLLFISIR